MHALEPVLAACAAAGVTLSLVDGQPFAAPRTALAADPKLHALLKNFRPMIVDYLKAQPTVAPIVVDDTSNLEPWNVATSTALARELRGRIQRVMTVGDVEASGSTAYITALITAACDARDMPALREAEGALDALYAWYAEVLFPTPAEVPMVDGTAGTLLAVQA